MAVYINTLIVGDITIGSSGHPETRFTLQDGTVETYDITGTLDQQWMIDNGYYDSDAKTWLKSITYVDIGNTITEMGKNTFRNCSEVMNIIIPNSVTDIGVSAFFGCSNLTCITLPNSIANIKMATFNGCSSLTSVVIPDSVTAIADMAFYNCSGLTSVTIPNSVATIGNSVFKSCTGLTSVTIPDSITFYSGATSKLYTFSGCTNITSVTIIANGGDAATVKQKMISSGVPEDITWNMPS